MTAKPTSTPAKASSAVNKAPPKVNIRARERAIVKIRELMEQFDIGFSDINPPAPKLKRAGLNHQAIPPKLIYRDPQSRKQWDGTGETPKWLVALEAKGHNRRSYLIKQGWGRVPSTSMVEGADAEAEPIKPAVKKAAPKKIVLKGVR